MDKKMKQYGSWVGVGLLFMWGSALIAWVDLWNSANLGAKALGFIGGCLVSASGIAIAIYTSALEQKLNSLQQQNHYR